MSRSWRRRGTALGRWLVICHGTATRSAGNHPAADAEDETVGGLSAAEDDRPASEHEEWRYLLRGLGIIRPNHVWCADIAHIPMRRDVLYLVAVMDWAGRRVLV